MPLLEGTILPIKEGALGNIRIIAFRDTDSPMRCVEPFAFLISGKSWLTCSYTGSPRKPSQRMRMKLGRLWITCS
ncbi:BnaA01g22880D [Brassica napus]|uniref:BnaA01g22880D protein n=1 Tax=Brassica napus TaxID=3708 RepID=A0A078IAH6_BRANA|nr:BnaA01g22880D [Brassica napus]